MNPVENSRSSIAPAGGRSPQPASRLSSVGDNQSRVEILQARQMRMLTIASEFADAFGDIGL